MQHYFDNYYDLYGPSCRRDRQRDPTEVRQFSAGFNTVLGFYLPDLEIVRDAYH